MTIESKKVVSLKYSLFVKGENHTSEMLFEQTSNENPFTFLFGAGSLLPDFEKNINGKKVGDTFDFHIDAANGYGIRDKENIVELPVDSFRQPDGTIDLNMLKVGAILPMRDQNGNHFDGKVANITAETVTMDFNHELAGHALHFKGEVLDIREAAAEELAHGHVHGPGGHHH